MNRKIWLIMGSLVLVAALMASMVAGCAKPAPTTTPTPKPEPIVIEYLSCVEEGHSITVGFHETYEKALNERAKGELELKWMGGPEVISGLDQPEAVSRGVIAAANTPVGYYKGTLPEANVSSYSRLTPMEEGDSGFYDLMVELHKEQMNARYVGRTWTWAPFYFFTNPLIEKPADLEGLLIRGVSSHKPFIDGAGATMVTMPSTDIYSGMERGLVEGHVYQFKLVVHYLG